MQAMNFDVWWRLGGVGLDLPKSGILISSSPIDYE
jgi:hypothetical protein